MRRLASNVLVVVLVAWALLNLVSAASSFWSVPATLGVKTDYGGTVRTVEPGSPADRAGIVIGDRLRLGDTPFEVRRYVAGVGAPIERGSTVDVSLLAHGPLPERHIRLVAVDDPLDASDRWTLLIVCVTSIIFIAIGGMLIVLRPSRATWGFGLYCLLELPVSSVPLRVSAVDLSLVSTFVYDIVQNLGIVGLIAFVLEFPRPFDIGWRHRIRIALPWLYVALAVLTLYPDIRNLLFGLAAQVENLSLQIIFGACFCLAVAILLDTYRRIAMDERERVRWLLIGFLVGLLTNYIGNTLVFSTLIVAEAPIWLINTLLSLNVLLPVTVAHAVIRHRVLDINFVIGRALIFTAMTTALAGVFGVFDWLFGSVLEDLRMTRVLSAAVSIAVAFTFSRIEERVIKWVEVLFFRKRRAADAHLDRLTRALPHAHSADVIAAGVVADVTTTLELASAAVFRIAENGTFQRMAAIGWDGEHCMVLDDTDQLVLFMRAERRLITVDDISWKRSDVPHGGGAPYIAVPMLSATDVDGLLIYSAHTDGSRLDPEEIAEIERLAIAAGLAFDQLDAQRLRAENVRLSAVNTDLLARLDEVRRAQRR